MQVRSLEWLLEFRDQASDQIKKVNKSLDDTTKTTKKLGEGMSKLGKGMMTKISIPLAGIGAAAIKSTADFDDGMSRVRSLTGATGKDFDRLREKAIQLGNDTAFSAQEASEGMQVLAASGMEVNDILETSDDMFSLMSAGSTDADTAASVLTNTMAQFNLTAKDSTAIVDTFAKGSAAAKLGVEDLEYIMGQAGGTLASMNMDMQQSVAMAGQLANAGMPIGQVGSALNAMGREIKANAKEFKEHGIDVYDDVGNLRDMGVILEDLERKLEGKSNEDRDSLMGDLFSGQAMKAATDWLSLGSDAYNELTTEINNASGASAEMAAINEDNIGGAFRSLSSSIGTLMISIGDVLKEPVKKVAGFVQRLADAFNNAKPKTQKFIVALGAVATALGPILFFGGKFLVFFADIDKHLKKVKKGFKLMKGFANPWLIGVIALIAGLTYLWKTNEEFRNSVIRAWESIKNIVERVTTFLKFLWDSFGHYIVATFKGVWDFITGILGDVVGVISSILGIISSVLSGDWAGLRENLGDLFNSLLNIFKNIFKSIFNIIKGVVAAIGKLFLGIVKGVVGGIVSFVGAAVSGIWQGVLNIIKNISAPIIASLQDLYRRFQHIFDGIGQVIKGFVGLFKNIMFGPLLLILDLITLDFEVFKEDSRMIWENIINAIQTILGGFVQYLSGIWGIVKSSTMNAWNNVKQTISNVIEWFFTLPGRALQAMVQLVQAMINGIKSGISSIKSAAREAGNSIINTLKEIPSKVVSIGKNIMTSLADGIKSGISAPFQAAKSVGSKIRGFLGGGGGGGADGIHRTGLSRVPFDGYRAILHKDEEVLTADDPRNINNAGRQAVRNVDKQPTTRVAGGGQQVAFSPSININIEGNTDVNTVRQIEEAVNNQMNLFFRKMNLQRA